MFSFAEIIDMAVQLEKNGEQTYRQAIIHCENEDFIQLLEWMAGEEVLHAEWFLKLKKNTDLIDGDEMLKEMSEALVEEFIQGQSFSLKTVDFSQIKDTGELIRIFIEFEKDTVLFYNILTSFISDDPTSMRLKEIISEEKTHIKKLNAFLDDDIE